MTIFRDDCGYEPLSRERAPDFGVDPDDAGFWYIEYEPCGPPGFNSANATPPGKRMQERLIPNTLAALASHRPILVGVTVPRLDEGSIE